ncbi:SMP-30/gluconolactonase/LRE family protein [Candidatus Foliamicus sp.]
MTEESTLKPFSPGDVFVGATLLNDPDDDHAGRGRIIQYDADLQEKGVLWIDDSTHLVGGLKFDPNGVLWAFDSNAHLVIRVDSSGRRLPHKHFAERSFSNVNFGPQGQVYLAEHMVGSEIRLPLQTELKRMPGSDRLGDGHVFEYDADGELVAEHATETHGGMGGFLGVTHSTLAPDGKTLVYVSETGKRIMRFDLEDSQQGDDVLNLPEEDRRAMCFAVGYSSEGKLLHMCGNAIDVLSEKGEQLRQVPLPGFGWATMCVSGNGRDVLAGNFFTGECARVNLDAGAVEATVNVGVERSLAGIAEFSGD